MELEVFIVHEDTDAGTDIEVFTDPLKEQEYCSGVMRAKGRQNIIKLLDQAAAETGEQAADTLATAWHEFNETESAERMNYRARHEVEVDFDPMKIPAMANVIETLRQIQELASQPTPDIAAIRQRATLALEAAK